MLFNEYRDKYKEFLSSIGIDNNLNWDFPVGNQIQKDQSEIEILLNNLAFSFFEFNSKEKLYKKIQNNELSEQVIMNVFLLIIEDFDNSQKKYPIENIRIEKFVDYLLEWIVIIDHNIKIENIEKILQNVHSKNQVFWFYLIKKLFDKGMYQETLVIIDAKKRHFDKKYYLEDIVLKEIECIRLNKNNYLFDKKMIEKLCKLSKHIKNYKYASLILKLECALLNNRKEEFEKIIQANYTVMKDFAISEILNIYELAILSKSHRAIGKVYIQLMENDIHLYKGFEEEKILNLLEAIRMKNHEIYKTLREEFENAGNYDFKHIDWHFQKNN